MEAIRELKDPDVNAKATSADASAAPHPTLLTMAEGPDGTPSTTTSEKPTSEQPPHELSQAEEQELEAFDELMQQMKK